MADVWLGRFNRAIEKLFNVKGGPTVVDVAHQVQSMWPLDKGVDQRYLEGWNRFASTVVVAGLAANFSRFRIRNPVSSNVIAVIELLLYSTATSAEQPLVTWGAITTDLTNLANLTFSRMDPRGNPQPTMIVSSVAQAAGGTAFLQSNITLNTPLNFINTEDQEIPILPGQAVDIQAGLANTQMISSVMWRERPLESSELT